MGLETNNARDSRHEPSTDRPVGAVEQALVARDAEPLFVVGLGASAGGLEALETFFERMPADAGMAFVVVQHLSPDFKSLMDELLSRRTEIPVHRVEDGVVVEPNAIYLIPPKKEMIIAGGRLLLTDKDPAAGLSLPIDTFFRSLAQEAGERAAAIVLSGTGSDGSRGVRAVHDAGGLVIAQSEETARFDGMPRSAIETRAVDLVLPPEAMPQALLDHVRRPILGARLGGLSGEVVSESGMNAIYALLRAEIGIDFTHYKPTTVLRRIDRRLRIAHAADLDEYVAALRSQPAELHALSKDLLIGVTRFFRDPEFFARLAADVVPDLVALATRDEGLRVWVAGCATGEEAYSLAMLFHEAVTAAGRPLDLKIFATDVHRASLEFASAGLYDEGALADVAPARRERYFLPQNGRWQIVPELRKLIVFAPHNVIKDAPFTKLDLISCRNLLIYLQAPAQKKALSLFHFGLKTGGVLALGPSESPGEIAEEFATLDPHWKLYRKRRDVRLFAEMRAPLAPVVPPVPPVPVAGSVLRRPRTALPDANLLRVYDELLEAYVPPSFLINAQREVLHAFAGAGRWLRVPDGRLSADLLDMVDRDLRLAISRALQRAVQENAPAALGGVRREAGGAAERLRVSVRPLAVRGAGEPYCLVAIEPDERPPAVAAPAGELDVAAASEQRLSELDDELRYAQENLQAAVEEMETTNEELQATNEELVASNEELQSTNEELHSVNEELHTVNAEHQRKITELTELTDDMDNLLRSTDVGTIFLDRELLIRKFTPRIAESFRLLPQDVGRRIDSFAHDVLHPGLLDDVRRVLADGAAIERDVQDKRGEWHLLRILPYRTQEAIEGAVVTLIPVTRLKKTEAELRRLSKVFMDGADPILIEDLTGTILDLNREAERAYGWSRAELVGQPVTKLIPPALHARSDALRQQCLRDDSVRNVEAVRCARHGEPRPVLLTLSLLHDESGRRAAIASIAKDISAQKQAEQDARDAARRRDQFLAMLSHELRNPLGALLNATRFVVRAGNRDPALGRACAVIERQGKQLARLLEDLLEVSRVTQGKIRVAPQIVDLVASAQEAVQVLQPLVDRRGHALETEFPERPLYVEGDPARLLQVQENLLENAAKYTPRGGTIRLVVREEAGEAVVTVRDNGVGVPPEMQSRIFELFVQSPQALEEDEAGMGIGLTLVQSIVSLHGGRVAVRSDGPGTGSEFEVRLPTTAERPAATPAAAVAPSPAGMRVVVVEDNADSREMLAALLTMDGYDVATAADGRQGVRTVLERAPDVALVDLGLPGIDGLEVARRIRAAELPRPVRLVALTGYGRAVDREAVFAAGFDEHLVKPVDPDELVRILRPPPAGS
ncbi:MAG: response regulator [Pirellulales bacterium]|nr:response regulator [Pirellulales bacterium]